MEPKPDKMKIAYLAPAVTALSATFVYKEILALERKGYVVLPFSVRAQSDLADGIDELDQRVVVVYNTSLVVFLLHFLTVIFTQPARTLTSFKLLLHDVGQVGSWVQKLKLVYQYFAGIWLAQQLTKKNVSHLHIHFGHVPTQIGMYASSQSGVPFSFMVHANDLFQRALLYSEKGARAAAVTTISDFNKSELVKQGVPVGKIHLVRCGINADEFKFAPKPDLSAPYKIGVVARLVHKKGIDVLVESLPILAQQGVDVDLEIAGDGPELGALTTLVDQLDLTKKVRFVGRIENHEVPDWLHQLDLFVLPARKDRNGDMDGVPVVLMEAMSQGVPVISSKISGIPELVIDRKTGIAVEPENPSMLAEAIIKITSDKNLREKLIVNASRYVNDEFSIEKNTQRLEQVLLQCQPSGEQNEPG